MAQVRARYENGSLTPLEPLGLELEEGAEVTVWLDGDGVAAEKYASGSDGAPGGGAVEDVDDFLALLGRIKELHKNIPPEEWDRLPTDLAKNKKHYLYGHAKEEGAVR